MVWLGGVVGVGVGVTGRKVEGEKGMRARRA
jgi:hypothetical protein